MEKSQVTALRETPDFLVLFYGQIFHPILQEIASLQAAPLAYRFITTEKSRSGSHEILRAAVLTVFIKQPRINIGCDVSEITQNDPWKAITFNRKGDGKRDWSSELPRKKESYYLLLMRGLVNY